MTLFDGHDELYQHAKFGEDRAARAGCRCENVVFFVTLRVRSAVCSRGHSSNMHCVAVYRSISTRFGSFFRKGLLFQKIYVVLTFVARWRQNFRKIEVKNCEKSKKSAEKFVRTTSYR